MHNTHLDWLWSVTEVTQLYIQCLIQKQSWNHHYFNDQSIAFDDSVNKYMNWRWKMTAE